MGKGADIPVHPVLGILLLPEQCARGVLGV